MSDRGVYMINVCNAKRNGGGKRKEREREKKNRKGMRRGKCGMRK